MLHVCQRCSNGVHSSAGASSRGRLLERCLFAFSFFYIEEKSLLIINYDGSYLKYVMILTEQTLIIIV